MKKIDLKKINIIITLLLSFCAFSQTESKVKDYEIKECDEFWFQETLILMLRLIKLIV